MKNGNWLPIPGEVTGSGTHSNIILKIIDEISEVRVHTDNLLNKEYIVSNFI
jgi:hypothetical protein